VGGEWGPHGRGEKRVQGFFEGKRLIERTRIIWKEWILLRVAAEGGCSGPGWLRLGTVGGLL
jgi:hypothetical protein